MGRLDPSLADQSALPLLGVGFELSAVPMILVDDSLRIAGANPAARLLLAAQELIGRLMTAIAAPPEAKLIARELNAFLCGELSHLERETDLLADSGDTVRVEVRLDAVLSSGRRFVLGQFRDVTDERQQTRELAASEGRYRQLVDNLPDSSVMLFDNDLRLVLAAGEALIASGYEHPHELAGRMITDLLHPRAWELLQPRYAEFLAGRCVDFEYDSPIVGRQFRVRVRPVTDRDGTVTGGLVLSEDVSEDRARRSQMEQVHRLGQFGSSSYDRQSGWSYDAELLALWGLEAAPEAINPADAGFPVTLLPPDDRRAVLLLWQEVNTVGGRHTLPYRIRHGVTGELRSLQSTHETVIDPDGVLIRVVATHIDISDTVAAAARADLDRATAAGQRLELLLQVTNALATSRLGPDELMVSIANLASTTIGEGAVIRILTPDLGSIERDVIAHPDAEVRRRLESELQKSAAWPVPSEGIPGQVVGKGKLVSRIRQEGWRPEYQELFAERVFADAAHFMIAPVRHNGAVLGMLAVVRMDPDSPYQPGDDDLLQVLADGAGAAIAESRVARRHHQLLEQLADLETRERTELAEGIHDEPIQHLAAGIMRLDYLSAHVDPVTRDELDRVAGQLETTADWLRNLIVVALNPPDLAAGLGPALAGLAKSIFAGTPTVLGVEGSDQAALTAPAKETAYRVLREALVNIRKHARATVVTLRIEERGDVVVLALSDDGIGSNSLDAGPGRPGVAAMRARAEASGGYLNIESIEGLGTEVTLTLPKSRVDQERPTTALLKGLPTDGPTVDTPRSDNWGPHSIVLCDDQRDLRDAVRLMMSDAPRFHVVGEASDGVTCLQRVREFRPDALIMDFSMPGGGPLLVKAARELHPGLHIIVFSGRHDARTRDAMLDAGANQYVVKTGRLRPLIEALDRAFTPTPGVLPA
jgi:PAS domain S-box-containing protein